MPLKGPAISRSAPLQPGAATVQTLALLAAAFGLAGCGGADAPDDPGAVSEGEAEALDEAASMLDETRLPEGALPEVDGPEVDAPEVGGTASEEAGEAASRSSGDAR